MFSAKSISFAVLVAVTAISAAPYQKGKSAPIETYTESVAAHNVSFCTSKNQRNCVSQLVLDAQCTEVGAQYDNKMASFKAPPPGVSCSVYADPHCAGNSLQIPSYGQNDVTDAGFAGNGVTNYMCQTNGAPTDKTSTQEVTAHTVTYCNATGFPPLLDASDPSGNPCVSQLAQEGQCTEVPLSWAGKIKSFEAPLGVTCTLFNYYLCEQASLSIVGSESDVGTNQGLSFSCVTTGATS